jgi:hypothetical protein
MGHNQVNISPAAFSRIRRSRAEIGMAEAPRREPPGERKEPPVRPPPQKRPPVEEPEKKPPVGDPPPKKRDEVGAIFRLILILVEAVLHSAGWRPIG